MSVDVPTSSVVPNINLPVPTSSLHPMKALSPVVPRSINIPLSLLLAPVNPLFNSIIVSLMVVLVDSTVVVVPVTLKLPLIVRSLNVPELEQPDSAIYTIIIENIII